MPTDAEQDLGTWLQREAKTGKAKAECFAAGGEFHRVYIDDVRNNLNFPYRKAVQNHMSL